MECIALPSDLKYWKCLLCARLFFFCSSQPMTGFNVSHKLDLFPKFQINQNIYMVYATCIIESNPHNFRKNEYLILPGKRKRNWSRKRVWETRGKSIFCFCFRHLGGWWYYSKTYKGLTVLSEKHNELNCGNKPALGSPAVQVEMLVK